MQWREEHIHEERKRDFVGIFIYIYIYIQVVRVVICIALYIALYITLCQSKSIWEKNAMGCGATIIHY